ncbi:hypothetical protein A3D06_00040 [Candidatus Roizmanbacteria bacterium RIFCSPHIGHO2_02_FULL_40_9]|uniref:Glycosyltransferase RgtA/B/C/D-like domain-containing protein n=1 Tax=Candidatus Roizmanbacteria bacterium RIFCSPHIGHO2_02_FULL_40_9 TaxID=1802042 RepID=A0A1F7HFC0_9BACT|nr:MAG: hypothetical protein A3D06_00040 [Candidatus Roizmanbacteria bacterium RIFCSPHIGHO2_02_FULL_40_9]
MKISGYLIILILFLFLATAFIYKSTAFLDPDFGWHITTGNIILHNGIPRQDIFSYTMQGFPFIAHSWLSEALFSILYPLINYSGLAMLLGIVASFSLILSAYKNKLYFALPILLLGASDIVAYIGVRPQVFSWLFFIALIQILFSHLSIRTKSLAVFAAIALWSNLHAGFGIGVGIILLKCIYDFFYNKKSIKPSLALLLAALFGSVLNPYGIFIWKEVLFTFFNPDIRFGINEWLPGALSLNFYLIPHLALSLALVIKFRSLVGKFHKVLYIILFLGAMTSSKLYPFWSLYSVYVSIQIVSAFSDSLADKLSKERLRIFLALIGVFSFLLFCLNFYNTLGWYKKYAEDSFYPSKAVQYLHVNLPEGNVFSLFAWGGYLIWKLPEKKVFVDGRMTYWNNLNPSANESKNALKEHVNLLKGKENFVKAASKYNIDTVLMPRNDKTFEKVLKQMKKAGWKRIYQDNTAEIYSLL